MSDRPTARVLVVDDDADVRRLIARLLSADFAVTVTEDGQSALDLFHSGQRFDAVVCDLLMPRLSGLDLYRAVRSLDPNQAQRFLFATASGAVSIDDEYKGPIIAKPFSPVALRREVSRVVGRR